MTLRHRLECKIKTADIVSVDSSDDICPLSPSEKPLQFAALLSAPDKAPWKKQDELHKEMLVCGVSGYCLLSLCLSSTNAWLMLNLSTKRNSIAKPCLTLATE